MAICKAESGLRNVVSKPNTNGSRDYGICQVNDSAQRNRYKNVTELLDIENNIRISSDIYRSWEGWGAWSVYNSKRYLNFLQ